MSDRNALLDAMAGAAAGAPNGAPPRNVPLSMLTGDPTVDAMISANMANRGLTRPVPDVVREMGLALRNGILDSVTTQNSPAERLARVVFPDYRSANTAGIYADNPDVEGMAMAFAGGRGGVRGPRRALLDPPDGAFSAAGGRPLLLHHGTNADFAVFKPTGDMGFHFTPNARTAIRIARTRASEAARNAGETRHNGAAAGSASPVVKSAYAKMKNPLRMRDMEDWLPSQVAEELEKMGVLSADEAGAFAGSRANGAEGARRLTDLLKSKGYDGIVYDNAFEGGGASYMLFDPEQIAVAGTREVGRRK